MTIPSPLSGRGANFHLSGCRGLSRSRRHSVRRLVSYRGRANDVFGFADELDLKRAQLAEIEAELAAVGDDENGGEGAAGRRQAA